RARGETRPAPPLPSAPPPRQFRAVPDIRSVLVWPGLAQSSQPLPPGLAASLLGMAETPTILRLGLAPARTATMTNGAGSVKQFDGDEPDLALADVLEVVDQRLVRRGLRVVPVAALV